MTGRHRDDPDPATPLRDIVEAIWDMRAEMWAGDAYDRLDTLVTDAYALGSRAGRADERRRIRQLAIDRQACCIEPRWGVHQRFADLLGDDDD